MGAVSEQGKRRGEATELAHRGRGGWGQSLGDRVRRPTDAPAPGSLATAVLS